jgi:y4mF family transcriptional regulator
MELGLFVREKRIEQNLTQQELAERAGVGLNFVYQLEKNKPTVQLNCARQVLVALGYDLNFQPQSNAAHIRKEFPVVRPQLPW